MKWKKWRWRRQIELPNGRVKRLSGTPLINTKEAAEQAERLAVERELALLDPKQPQRKEVPPFSEWFNGPFWTDYVLVVNKPSEQESKRSIYQHHLDRALGRLPLDEITPQRVASFRAELVRKGLSKKRVNNILCVLGKVLRYAVEMEVLDRVPRLGLLKHERPDVEWWEFEEYARLVGAAREAGALWYAAVALAGEAGLRVGEVKALRWDDVDLVGGTLTVERQIRKGIVGTPKGGRRRKVPMTATLVAALKRLEVVRTGYVLRNPDGTPIRDGQAANALRRICRRAGLPPREWHTLRHTYGTHLALLGVNPFKLQAWMGHAQMTETLRYVHVASAHGRPLPPAVVEAGSGEGDPDRRVLRMLSARAPTTSPSGCGREFVLRAFRDRRGKVVPKPEEGGEKVA
jgi:integrase